MNQGATIALLRFAPQVARSSFDRLHVTRENRLGFHELGARRERMVRSNMFDQTPLGRNAEKIEQFSRRVRDEGLDQDADDTQSLGRDEKHRAHPDWILLSQDPGFL